MLTSLIASSANYVAREPFILQVNAAVCCSSDLTHLRFFPVPWSTVYIFSCSHVLRMTIERDNKHFVLVKSMICRTRYFFFLSDFIYEPPLFFRVVNIFSH
jgi:hypothetical protein